MTNVTTVDFTRKEQKDGKVIIVFNSNEQTTISCSSINASEILPGFIEVWRNEPEDALDCFINSSSIKTITLVFEEDE